MANNRVFVGELYGNIMLGHSKKDRVKAAEIEVLKYFPSCPICGREKIQVNVVLNGKNTISCLSCGCEWQICFGLVWGRLEWAKLEKEAYDGKGKNLLEKVIGAPQWFEMAEKSRGKLRKQNKN
jgi:hypothetical protein